MKDSKEIIVQPWVQALLEAPLVARLATANPRTLQPHVVARLVRMGRRRIVDQLVRFDPQDARNQGHPLVSISIGCGRDGGSARGSFSKGRLKLSAIGRCRATLRLHLPALPGCGGCARTRTASWAGRPG